MVVLQSPFQKVMAQKLASKGVCVDTTHGTTGYNFLLTSILVVDEYGEGFPIAWCLSNHEDFTHMCIFYKMVKQNCGILTPRWLMSDLATQFYNAWVGIMGNRPIRLMCTWHVDKAWQTELRAKVKDAGTVMSLCQQFTKIQYIVSTIYNKMSFRFRWRVKVPITPIFVLLQFKRVLF
jgi:hypothetical protein